MVLLYNYSISINSVYESCLIIVDVYGFSSLKIMSFLELVEDKDNIILYCDRVSRAHFIDVKGFIEGLHQYGSIFRGCNDSVFFIIIHKRCN
jgi:hypothetical protein